MNDNQMTQETVATQPETMTTAYFVPLVDVIENLEAFVFQADLPGVRASDLDVNFDNGVLTIDGKVQPREAADRSYSWKEYGVGHFYRQFTLRTPVDSAGIKAELKNGELTVTVPKADSAKPRKVEIQATWRRS